MNKIDKKVLDNIIATIDVEILNDETRSSKRNLKIYKAIRNRMNESIKYNSKIIKFKKLKRELKKMGY